MTQFEGDLGEGTSTVRPYTVTGGRTRPVRGDLPVEALVRATGTPELTAPPERRRILALAAESVVSVAELSAHLLLPLGVVRVLVGDLAADGLVSVIGADLSAYGSTGVPSAPPATNIKVLESVLNGISAL
jgi:hypothetical protein